MLYCWIINTISSDIKLIVQMSHDKTNSTFLQQKIRFMKKCILVEFSEQVDNLGRNFCLENAF